MDDGVRTGIMYVASDSLCENELDGEVLFEYTKIDGKDFICTNDLIRVNEDGSFSYAGRADRYFVNNEGMRFEPGIVEVRVSSHPNIDKCAVVPVLEKRIHDTVPVLFVIPKDKGPNAEARVIAALKDVFTGKDCLDEYEIPMQFVVVDSIPCNSNGKIDIYKITRERLSGTAYNIVPIHKGDVLTDLEAELVTETSSIVAGSLPQGRQEASAFDLYKLLNSTPEKSDRLFDPFAITERIFGEKKTPVKHDDVEPMAFTPPKAVVDIHNKVMGRLYHQLNTDHCFEA